MTPAISTVRVRVTQSAGNIAGWSLRLRAVTSSAVAVRAGDQAGDPAGDAETSGGGHDAEQDGCGEHPQYRREPDATRRAFVIEPTSAGG